MNKLRFYALVLVLGLCYGAKADEGMWLPILLQQQNLADMQAKGFKLSAEDIYSVNQACLKDAVVIFGRGCTGELISGEGLLLTNHHCGYGQIQEHSSLEHDYLTDGFWAMSREEELTNPGLSVRFLVRMESVTTKVLEGVTDQFSMKQREQLIEKNIEGIAKEATKGTHYEARVETFYAGNEYYLFIEERFTDVRLVGAPPSAIGKFGGDTDNWMWPRHTGDFSIFRVYANKDNEPAEYSPKNVPYKPKKHFKISMKGVKEGDFTMVMGFPGRTQEYLASGALSLITEVSNPNKIRIRQTKIDILSRNMNADDKVRIQYSAKYASISNAWKKWKGENRGLQKLNAIENKQAYEKRFQLWVDSTADRKAKYGNLLVNLEKTYEHISPLWLAGDYYREAGLYLELMSLGDRVGELVGLSLEGGKRKRYNKVLSGLQTFLPEFYKDFDVRTDKEIFESVLELWTKQVDSTRWHPALVDGMTAFKGDTKAFVAQLYDNSIFTKPDDFQRFMYSYERDSVARLQNDPLFRFFVSMARTYHREIRPKFDGYVNALDSLNLRYMRAQRAMEPDRLFYPDANFTMRIAYGKVSGYKPNNAVIYEHFTTIEGIMEKDDPTIYDYKVPEKLKKLYKRMDYGRYGEDGDMPVCFIATNHTTGGNSGSPVIDAEGNLIGINFDRSWESTMSDIMFDPDQCRNITLDIRYALFIIDKFAGAKHLVDEMTLVE